MKLLTRTEYSVKNAYISSISRIAAILMGYMVRVVFTHTLSESYVGINGLFTNILNLLALSELGIDSAITYALYRPIAESKRDEQKSLLRLCRRYYRMAAMAVILIGLLALPFMYLLIKNQTQMENLILIYLLYLLNPALSYLLIYKKSLIDANQLYYIGIFYQTVFWVIQDILQIIILLTTKNFILFLLVFLLGTIGGNICISGKANQLYPYVKEKNVKPLERIKRKEIAKNIQAMFLHKIGNIAVNNTNNLILSSFVGIISSGIYSNYYLIIQSVNQMLSQMFKGLTASIGSLAVTRNVGRVKKVYETAFFISHWMYGLGAICLYELLEPFILISFGKSYLFSREIALILCIIFFITGMKDATLIFRDSLGLFRYDKYISILCAALNLIISILLVRQYHTIGVFAGALASLLLTSAWLEPFVLYKFYLKLSFYPFLMKYLWYSFSIGAIWYLTDYLCQYITGSLSLVLLSRMAVCALVPNLLLSALHFRSVEFGIIIEKGRGFLYKWKNRGIH
jgi:O-antigen/teichoic acid export membrane protein